MKYINLVFIFAILISETLIGQKAEPIRLRHSYQQKFIINEFLLKKQKIVIDNTIELDSLFTVVTNSWKLYVKDSLSTDNNNIPAEALNNLDAYSYLWTLLSVTGKTEQRAEIELHLFKNYMLPSLICDYQYIRANPSLNSLKLIWAGSLSNTLFFGVKYYDNSETFKSFYELHNNLKALLHSFENSDELTKAFAAKLLNFMYESDYEIETKKYFYSNQQDISFTYFITGISANKYPKQRVMPFGEILIKSYLSKGENDKCLAILNNVFFNTSNDELPGDTLFKWYNIVDPVNGSKLYNEVSGKLKSNYFKTANKSSVHLPQRWNLIFNSIPQEKIKNAKYILIDFWYSSCSPCIAEVPELNELYTVIKNRDDIVFISINSDFSTTHKDSIYVIAASKNINIKFPVVFDNRLSDFTKQFNVSGYPSKFIINAQGQFITKEDGSPVTLSTFYDFIKMNK
jgi:thiol-disulfide isomerase/thioredoxin